MLDKRTDTETFENMKMESKSKIDDVYLLCEQDDFLIFENEQNVGNLDLVQTPMDPVQSEAQFSKQLSPKAIDRSQSYVENQDRTSMTSKPKKSFDMQLEDCDRFDVASEAHTNVKFRKALFAYQSGNLHQFRLEFNTILFEFMEQKQELLSFLKRFKSYFSKTAHELIDSRPTCYSMNTDSRKYRHIIMAIDTSTSMYGSKWEMLIGKLDQFLANYSPDGSTRDVITVLNFGSAVLEVVKKSRINRALIDKIAFIGYHATYLTVLLQKIIDIMQEHYDDNAYLFSIVIMTDGKTTFTERGFHIMDKLDCLCQKYDLKMEAFRAMGFGDSANFEILRKMCDRVFPKGRLMNSHTDDLLLV
jgi:hypothetical protein